MNKKKAHPFCWCFFARTHTHKYIEPMAVGWRWREAMEKANEEQNGNDNDSHGAENNSNYDCWWIFEFTLSTEAILLDSFMFALFMCAAFSDALFHLWCDCFSFLLCLRWRRPRCGHLKIEWQMWKSWNVPFLCFRSFVASSKWYLIFILVSFFFFHFRSLFGAVIYNTIPNKLGEQMK